MDWMGVESCPTCDRSRLTQRSSAIFSFISGYYSDKVVAVSLRSMIYLPPSVPFLRRLEKPLATLLTARGRILRHAAQDNGLEICDRKGNSG